MVRHLAGGELAYEVVHVRQDGQELIIVDTFTVQDIPDIVDRVGKRYPVLLNLNGQGFIHKKVAAVPDYLNLVLLNANPSQFYTYTVKETEYYFVTVSRKDVVQRYLTAFEDSGLTVIDFSLGDFVAARTIDLIQAEGIRTAQLKLTFEAMRLHDFERMEPDAVVSAHALGTDQLTGDQLVLLGTLLEHLYPDPKVEYERQLLVGNQKHRSTEQLFNYAVGIGLGSVLFLLLLSYGLLSYFNTQIVAEEEKLFLFNDNYTQLKAMETEVENQRYLINTLGILNSNFKSYYLNEINKTLPAAIVLNELRLNPLQKKIKQGEALQMVSNSIVITGASKNGYYLNQWLKELKATTWAYKIEIVDFAELKDNTASFTLKIELQ